MPVRRHRIDPRQRILPFGTGPIDVPYQSPVINPRLSFAVMATIVFPHVYAKLLGGQPWADDRLCAAERAGRITRIPRMAYVVEDAGQGRARYDVRGVMTEVRWSAQEEHNTPRSQRTAMIYAKLENAIHSLDEFLWEQMGTRKHLYVTGPYTLSPPCDSAWARETVCAVHTYVAITP